LLDVSHALPLQTAQIKQGREKEKLKITHDKQLENLSHDLQKVSFIVDLADCIIK